MCLEKEAETAFGLGENFSLIQGGLRVKRLGPIQAGGTET